MSPSHVQSPLVLWDSYDSGSLNSPKTGKDLQLLAIEPSANQLQVKARSSGNVKTQRLQSLENNCASNPTKKCEKNGSVAWEKTRKQTKVENSEQSISPETNESKRNIKRKVRKKVRNKEKKKNKKEKLFKKEKYKHKSKKQRTRRKKKKDFKLIKEFLKIALSLSLSSSFFSHGFFFSFTVYTFTSLKMLICFNLILMRNCVSMM